MQANIPAPNNGNSTLDNLTHLLSITESNEPHYEFIFSHQGDIENYRYFQSQINLNQMFLTQLYNYRNLLTAKSERGVHEQQNPLAELNHEIARYEALLASARYYLSQVPVSIGNANVPNEY